MASEDITFCANKGCSSMKCDRNPKHIKLWFMNHSFALFEDCPKWDPSGARWLTKQFEEMKDGK